MAKKNQFKKDVDSLRDDAAGVMEELSDIAKSLKETGKEWSKEIREEMGDRLDRDIETIKRKLNELEDQSREYLEMADEHVRTNPYYYIAGSMGLGVLLGKLLGRGARSEGASKS
ncbi:MAG: hypothetical protein AB7T49_07660 [Oligoflexales bacterium]